MTERVSPAEADRALFADFATDLEATRDRLGLEPGLHVFNTETPGYSRVDISVPNEDDQRGLYITLHTNPHSVGVSPQGDKYKLKYQRTLYVKGDRLRYEAIDDIVHKWPAMRDEDETQLAIFENEFDFSEPLPVGVTAYLHHARSILPGLTMESYDPEASELDEPVSEELLALQEEMSTAAGVIALLEFAFQLERQKTIDSSVDIHEAFVASSDSAYGQQVRAIPDSSDHPEVWDPTIFVVRNVNGHVRTQNDVWDHVVARTLYVDEIDGSVRYEVEDSIELPSDGESKQLDIVDQRFEASEPLSDAALSAAKTMLRAVAGN